MIKLNKILAHIAVCAFMWVSAVFAITFAVNAKPIPFTVEFGTDGTGTFVYEDGTGGELAGFTVFNIDFSSVHPSLSSINLSEYQYQCLGPGGACAAVLFQIFTDPSSMTNSWIGSSFFDPRVTLSFAGQSTLHGGLDAGCGTTRVSTGGYAYCAGALGIGANGVFSTTMISAPGAAAMLALGFGSIWITRRRRAE